MNTEFNPPTTFAEAKKLLDDVCPEPQNEQQRISYQRLENLLHTLLT